MLNKIIKLHYIAVNSNFPPKGIFLQFHRLFMPYWLRGFF